MGARLETERGCRGRHWSTIQILGAPFLSSWGGGIKSAWEVWEKLRVGIGEVEISERGASTGRGPRGFITPEM